MPIDDDDFQEPLAVKQHRFGWFAAGGLLVGGAFALFLYSTGYFASPDGAGAHAGEPRTIIESKK